jgi:4-amino-4-deoxy-L-arabinose transferase-like glycosyltransferase
MPNTDTRVEVGPSLASVAVIALALIVLAVARLNGPPDLMNYAQPLQAAYAFDVVHNGNWICQRDDRGEITSKPPLYTWLVALAAMPFGRINRLLLSLPAIVATIAIALLVFGFGRRRFGWTAGFLGAIAYVTAPLTAKQIVLVRADGLFALTVMLTALAGWNAWQKGGGWTWFWLAAAAATLTKGPLGVYLGAAGLVAAFWEKGKGGRGPANIARAHLPGIALYLALTLGWFSLAWWQMGHALIAKMFGQELYGNAVYAHNMTVFPGRWFYKPPLYFIKQFAPWSVAVCLACWRIWCRPSPGDTQRRLERFLVFWIWIGIIPFCLGASQRADHLMPLTPAAALLAGHEMAQWSWLSNRRRAVAFSLAAVVVGLVAAVIYRRNVAEDNKYILRTIQVKSLAERLENAGASRLPLTHVDSPFALQFYLNTMRPTVSCERAAKLLAGDATAFVAVHDLARLKKSYPGSWESLYPVARSSDGDDPWVTILSNHPRLEWTDCMALAVGPFTVRMQGVQLLDARGSTFVFASRGQPTQPRKITVTNDSATAQTVRIEWQDGGDRIVQSRSLTPGQTWEVPGSASL